MFLTKNIFRYYHLLLLYFLVKSQLSDIFYHLLGGIIPFLNNCNGTTNSIRHKTMLAKYSERNKEMAKSKTICNQILIPCFLFFSFILFFIEEEGRSICQYIVVFVQFIYTNQETAKKKKRKKQRKLSKPWIGSIFYRMFDCIFFFLNSVTVAY